MLNGLVTIAASGSVLDEAMKALVQNGFDSLQATGTEIIGMGVVAAVGIGVLSSAVNFAIKWVVGTLRKAT